VLTSIQREQIARQLDRALVADQEKERPLS
jgi:hypothetical protein